MSEINTIDAQIRTILKDHARLVDNPMTLAPDNDLYQAGMNSLSSVNVMLALEDAFSIEFPDHMLNKKIFGSIAAIREALIELIPA
jgi:acyl carrier protein